MEKWQGEACSGQIVLPAKPDAAWVAYVLVSTGETSWFGPPAGGGDAWKDVREMLRTARVRR